MTTKLGILITVGLGLATACLTPSAWAGPNANGTLILHYGAVVYCIDPDDLCQYVQDNAPLLNCADGNPHFDGGTSAVQPWAVYAAFPEEASPRLAGVIFGIDYDDTTVFVQDAEGCGSFELFTESWPAPGEGTAITWGSAQTSTLVHVYTFAGYEYYGLDTSFDLTPHPNGGGVFADDDVPSNLDPIVDYGRLGFNGDPGYLPCPGVGGGLGACCFADCTCEVILLEDCEAAGGDYQGEGTSCEPNPCPCPPLGACCLDGECTLRTEFECAEIGGLYFGDAVPCDPNPCPVPTVESSWGQIKDRYR